ncbi:MAG: universal stress protein [Nodosilinea sp.]
MFEHILVAIDPSASSHCAFDAALNLAQTLAAQLTLVHALDRADPDGPRQPYIPTSRYSAELNNILQTDYEYRWEKFIRYYDSLLKQKQAAAEAVGVRVSYLQPCGCPGPALCSTAKNSQADLIVAGSHSRDGLSEVFLYRASRYVMYHAPCPVLIVNPQAKLSMQLDHFET